MSGACVCERSRMEWVGAGKWFVGVCNPMGYLRPSQASAVTIRPSRAVLGFFRAHATEGSNWARGAFIWSMLPSSAAISSASARPRLTAALGTEVSMRTALAVASLWGILITSCRTERALLLAQNELGRVSGLKARFA